MFGVRRATMSWSLLWQNTVPMLLGLMLALPTGTGLGMPILTVIDIPSRPYWQMAGAAGAASLAVVGLVTAASMPLLWRLMGPPACGTNDSTPLAGRNRALVSYPQDEPTGDTSPARPQTSQ